MTSTREKPPLVDNPSISELYVDDGWFAFDEARGMLSFTFTVARVHDEKDTNTKGRYVAARLAMPLPAGLVLHQRLAELVKHLTSTGKIQRVSEGPKTKQ